jgi:hypothetical protein
VEHCGVTAMLGDVPAGTEVDRGCPATMRHPRGKQGGRHRLQRGPPWRRCAGPGTGWRTASCSDASTQQQVAAERRAGAVAVGAGKQRSRYGGENKWLGHLTEARSR